jgi:hypothetical protein
MYNMVLYLCVLIVFSFHRESLKLILATDPLPRWFCHKIPQEQHTVILIFRCGPDSSSVSSSTSSLTLLAHVLVLSLYGESESALVNGEKSYAGRSFATAFLLNFSRLASSSVLRLTTASYSPPPSLISCSPSHIYF